jgi:hypothetical protein
LIVKLEDQLVRTKKAHNASRREDNKEEGLINSNNFKKFNSLILPPSLVKYSFILPPLLSIVSIDFLVFVSEYKVVAWLFLITPSPVQLPHNMREKQIYAKLETIN